MRTIKKILLIIFILGCASDVCAQGANSYALFTKYPSAYGAYSSIQFFPIDVSEDDPCKVGMMYFRESDGTFRCCQNNGTGLGAWISPTIWGKSGDYIYLDVGRNENLGLVAPNGSAPFFSSANIPFKLTLDSDGSILAKGTYGSGATLITAGKGAKLIWYPRKAAFRAGYVDSTEWNDSNIGDYSVALGYNAKATGYGAVALGQKASATSTCGLAMGYQSSSTGRGWALGYQATAIHSTGNGGAAIGYRAHVDTYNFSTAIGAQASSSGYGGTAIGNNSTVSFSVAFATAIGAHALANAQTSTAIGFRPVAGGEASTAIGATPQTIGQYSTAIGSHTSAEGERSTAISTTGLLEMTAFSKALADYSTVIGRKSTASGKASFAIGYECQSVGADSFALGRAATANAYRSFVFGRYNIISGDTTSWVLTDPLFVLGNGDADTNRNNALTVLKNGNVGIKTDAPKSRLHIMGIEEYADNATAIASGLNAGDFYRTGDELRIVF